MQKVSLGVIGSLLLLAFIGILSQNGHATTITWLSLAPLGLYLAVAAISAVVLAVRRKKPTDNTLKSFALPLLFLLHFNFSGWWLLLLLLVAVWTWALTRESEGDYDFGPGFALAGAIIFTIALAIGAGAGWLLA